MSFGVDYAWFSTDLKALIAALKAHGVTFVARYLSHSSGKNLTPDEAAALSAAKIAITVVWETAADRALAGHAAGAQDARDALAEAKACGMPAGRPIFFAVDFDASNGQEGAISTYLDGAASVLGKDRTGVYGGYNVVKHALDGDHLVRRQVGHPGAAPAVQQRPHHRRRRPRLRPQRRQRLRPVAHRLDAVRRPDPSP
jgi:hypothetical protein